MFTRAARRGRTSRFTYAVRVSSMGSAWRSLAVTWEVSPRWWTPGSSRAWLTEFLLVRHSTREAAVETPEVELAEEPAGAASAGPAIATGTPRAARASAVVVAPLNSLTCHSLHAW